MNIKKFIKLPWRNIISVIVLVLFAILVVKNWHDFVISFDAIKNADKAWLSVAVCGMVLTYVAAAGGYIVVSIKKLSKLFTFLAQVAAAFANKLLPSGVGGLGLNVAYLHKNNYTPAEATTVTAVNSLAAFVSFNLLFISVLLAGGLKGSTIKAPNVPAWIIMAIIALIAIVGVVLAKNIKIRKKISGLLSQVLATIRAYKSQPLRLVGAVLMATLVTFAYLLALYASARSLGANISISEVFFVYVLGALATAAVPTPGGLGAAEAALYLGFVSYGVEPSLALSVTLAYRFITYWVPILPGYLSFQFLQRKELL